MKFQNREHEGNLLKLLVKDQSHPRDKERRALFYILAGNADLYSKADRIYDFNEHLIKLECLNDGSVDLCSSSRALVKLAYNLYNGYEDSDFSPMDIFSNLDTDNYHLAMESLNVRFGYTTEEKVIHEDDEEMEM